KDANAEIYKSMIDLYNKNEPVDLVTLSEELKRRGNLDNIGGITYLANLSSGVATTSNISYYCKIEEEKSILRKLIKSSDEIMLRVYEDSEDVNIIMEKAEKNIFDITQGAEREGFTPIDEVLLDSFAKIEEMAAGGGGLTGLATGFIDLDNSLSGLQGSDLILLAARPSMGKTALGLNIATNVALKEDASVGVFSLEM